MAFIAAPLAVHAETPAENDSRMKWFNEASFGMFIHWGVYSQAAGRWNGKPLPADKVGEWIQDWEDIPAAEYRAKLQPAFNPVKYDPDAWVRAARDAGIKYLVITSKHHDGFCLWDSKLTDWDVASTPYGKDLLKPLAEACETTPDPRPPVRLNGSFRGLPQDFPDFTRGNRKTTKPLDIIA